MLLPILLAAAQIGLPAKATTADTAYAIQVLDSARAALLRVERPQHDAPRALLEQVYLWRGHEAAWRNARALDESKSASGHFFKMWILAQVMRDGRAVQARDYLLELPTTARDSIIGGLPNFMGQIPAEMLELLPGMLTTTRARAEYLHARASALKHLQPRMALDTLRRAVAIMRQAGRSYPLSWAVEQISLGDRVAVDTLVELAAIESGGGNRAYAVGRVAEVLRMLPRTASAPIGDTLLAQLRGDTTVSARWATASLLELRGAPGDSSAAVALQQSTRPRNPEVDRRMADYAIRDALQRSVRSGDTAEIERSLGRWRSSQPSAQTLLGAVSGFYSRPAWYSYGDPPLPPEEHRYASAVVARLWSASATLPPAGTDSVRMQLIKVMARLNPAAAVDSARKGFSSPSQRDLGRAEALRRLVLTDADRAEDEARTLKDPGARDTAYAALAKGSIAGGRLRSAREFAGLITDGVPAWVSTRFALARALASSGAQTDANEALRQVLSRLNPVPACSGCPRLMDEPPPPPALGRREIIDIIALALQHDLRREVDAWGLAQTTEVARMWAWVSIADALSMVKLGRHPSIPVH